MGPTEGPSNHHQNQERTKKSRRRPRTRLCLLKGCDKRFRPNKAAQRYCSDECREAARKWSLWKAQLRYRATEAGKRKRKAQCRRNRKRVKERKKLAFGPDGAVARVISTDFFRLLLRPAWLLRDVRAQPKITTATVLLKGMPASSGTGSATGKAVEGSPTLTTKVTIIFEASRKGTATCLRINFTAEIIPTY